MKKKKLEPLKKCADILVVTLMLSSCSTAPKTSSWVEVDDVLANPSAFAGRKVTIKGWASIRNEDKGIWATPDDYANRNRRRCISLLNTYRDEEINRSLDRKYVLVTGTIDPDSYHDSAGQGIVRLGSCNKVGVFFEDPAGLRIFEK
jgi:hypothetical protein